MTSSSTNRKLYLTDAITILASPASLWLLIWMINNIGVTLLNKAAFAKVDFHYPWVLSAIHMLCNYIGSEYIFYTIRTAGSSPGICGKKRHSDDDDDDDDTAKEFQPLAVRLLGGQSIQRKELDSTGYRTMLAFSILFTLNIAIGNLSLKYVTVNFNQVMRSLVPAVTIAIGILYLKKDFSTKRKLAVVPIMIGVAMACFGDMSYTAFGFIITAICVFLAALKAVASGELLTGNLKLHPVDLLAHMAPLAMVQCLIVALLSGEIQSILQRWDTDLNPFTVSSYPMFVVWMSGFASFTLNISSFQANKVTSPLTLCIAANVKQVIMIWLGTIIFETNITPLNAAGIVVVLAGSARYSYVCLQEKEQPPTQKLKKITPTQILRDDSETDHNHRKVVEITTNSVNRTNSTSIGDIENGISKSRGGTDTERIPLMKATTTES